MSYPIFNWNNKAFEYFRTCLFNSKLELLYSISAICDMPMKVFFMYVGFSNVNKNTFNFASCVNFP